MNCHLQILYNKNKSRLLFVSKIFFSDSIHDSGDGDYGIEDVRSDQDSDNDEEDETRIPGWAKGSYFSIRGN